MDFIQRQQDWAHSNAQPSILLVEDEATFAWALQRNLEFEGYEVTVKTGVRDAVASFQGGPPDLVLLDLMLPDGDGFDVLCAIRERNPFLPVIITTARASEDDRIHGLDLGADDYLCKPFGLPELLARIRARLRQSLPAPPADQNAIYLWLDAERRVARIGPETVPLTRREFALLEKLCDANGAYVRDRDLLRDVWGFRILPRSQTVKVHIANLRRKLQVNPNLPPVILTGRGLGYRINSRILAARPAADPAVGFNS